MGEQECPTNHDAAAGGVCPVAAGGARRHRALAADPPLRSRQGPLRGGGPREDRRSEGMGAVEGRPYAGIGAASAVGFTVATMTGVGELAVAVLCGYGAYEVLRRGRPVSRRRSRRWSRTSRRWPEAVPGPRACRIVVHARPGVAALPSMRPTHAAATCGQRSPCVRGSPNSYEAWIALNRAGSTVGSVRAESGAP